MPRLTRIYTRSGDNGNTSLAGGQRLSKGALRIEAYGTVDELNSVIGLAVAQDCVEDVDRALARVQNELFHLGSDLSLLEGDKPEQPAPVIDKRHVEELEEDLDRFSEELEPLENFILPGGSRTAAILHVARTVCRRAERLTVRLAAEEEVGPWVVSYLNRLSDFLFTAARLENRRRDVTDVLWDSRA